ncbi:MAG: ABC transporter substrate-binding protein [Clostridia bacterium]|nr:ABC transporter substrate-binding protein [Clostridia bacterium]
MKKLLSLVIAMVLCLTALPFAMAEADVPVIDWYIGGADSPADLQMVNDALNEYLVEKIGCKVNITYMTSTDWEQKMGTMLSSGQDCGIVGFGSQSKSDYVIESQRGSFYPLDELLEEYGEDTYALFPDEVWDGMRIGGKIYGIPSKKDNGYFISLIYNADMVEDLGIDLSDLDYSNFRDLEDLFYETKEARDAKYPEMAEYPIVWSVNLFYPYFFAFETFLNDSYLAVANIDGIMDIEGFDSDTVFNFYDTPEFLEYCLQRQKLVADGIYLYDYTDKSEMRKPDHGVCYYVGWGYTYMQEHLYSEEWTSKMIMSDTIWTETNNYFSAGTAISANCAHPDLAFQVLNLVNTDPYVATMMRFGLEGVHWVRGEDGKMTFDFEGGRNRVVGERGYYFWYNAPVGNLTIVEAPESLVGPNNEMMTVMNELNEACIIPSHLGFVFDIKPVTNEVAACTSVVLEYSPALIRGQFETAEDVEATVAEFREKLHANGVDAIVEEVQRQIDAWAAAK